MGAKCAYVCLAASIGSCQIFNMQRELFYVLASYGYYYGTSPEK